MTDQEALKILSSKHIENQEEFVMAVFTAAKRLEACQWYPYDPDTFAEVYRPRFGMQMILGIRYEDGSRGSVDGLVVYDVTKQWKLVVAKDSRSRYTDSAVIEKFMKYPQYNESQL